MLAPHVAFWAGLVPLAWCAGQRVRDRRAWWLASSFAVSWAGDLAMRATGEWWVSVLWLPVQLGAALLAFASTVPQAIVIVFGLPPLAWASHTLSPDGPDLALTLLGSLALVWTAREPLVPPVILYFGVGTIAYVLMARHAGTPEILPYWYGYQACRLAAFLAFCAVVR